MRDIIRIPCVAAILYNSDDQILLQQRDNKPDLPFAGYWTLFGGKIEMNETPAEAIKRELIEEIDLKPQLTHWKTYERIHTPSILIVQYIFIGQITKRAQDITLYEGQSHGLFLHQQLHTLQIGFGFDQLLDEYFAH
jgi:8-oxo-dGTP diphosphatase